MGGDNLRRWAPFISSLSLAVFVGTAFGQAEQTLNKCQATVSKATLNFEQAYIKALSGCANAISKAVIQRQTAVPPGAAADAAKKCVRPFLKLYNSAKPSTTLSAQLATKIAAACDPSTNAKLLHTEGDVVGAGPLAESVLASNLGAWCSKYGGDGTIATLDDWVDCVASGATCAARQQVALTFPRLLEWLNGLRPAILALDSTCAATCASCSDPSVRDACMALEEVELAIDGSTDDDSPDITCGVSPFDIHCGDGILDAGEDCDFGDLDGESCQSLGAVTGDLACGAGCVFDTSDCSFPRYVFRTQGKFSGNLGGLAGADAICQSQADSAGLSGTFVAFLSTSTTDAIDRLTDDYRDYYTTHGVPKFLATDKADLLDGLAASIAVDAQGAATDANPRTWTGTDTGGVAYPSRTCSNWTATSGSGEQGNSGVFANTQWYTALADTCSNQWAFYCFEQ